MPMNYKLEDQINISRKKGRQMRGVLMGDDNVDGIGEPGREAELFRLAFEFSAIGMALLSVDGRWLRVNRAATEILGCSRDELRGMTCHEITHQDDLAGGRDHLHRLLAGEISCVRVEKRYRHRDGRYIGVCQTTSTARSKGGGTLCLASQIEDINERKRTKELLHKREQEFRALMENSPDFITRFDRDCRCIYINPSLGRVLGIESSLGKSPVAYYQGTKPSVDYETAIRRVLENGEEVRFQFPFKGTDGRDYHVDMRIVPERDSEGAVASVLAIGRDITDRMRLEEQLRQAQKMGAVGQLAGGIAHDFNNILTAIIGFAHVIEMKLHNDSPLVPFLNNITHAAEKAAALTNDLLTFSRKNVAQQRPVDLNEAVAKTGQLMMRLIREDIRLTVSRSESPLIVMADDSQLSQVLLNLTVNARDAMPQGGRIAVTTSSLVMDRDYVERHGYGKPGKFALIIFSDTGCGMDEKTRERIFEPFFTTKEVGKGTGLGLATVYGIVRQLDGFINVYSEPGKGTVFRIYLPEINEAPTAAETARSYAPMPGGNETVLLAEDEPIVRQMAESLLSEAGYTVITANDGAEAMGIFRDRGESVDLLVLDAIMPEKNGLEVLREAMVKRPDVAAIMMSGYTSEVMVMNGFIKRGVRFLQKPVNPRQFLGAVREVLDKAGSGL
jgi:two-component system cell cycle sensor histidine kinase/response regulator CckA